MQFPTRLRVVGFTGQIVQFVGIFFKAVKFFVGSGSAIQFFWQAPVTSESAQPVSINVIRNGGEIVYKFVPACSEAGDIGTLC